MNQAQVLGYVRQGLTILGTAIATAHPTWIGGDNLNLLIGGVIAAISIAWSHMAPEKKNV